MKNNKLTLCISLLVMLSAPLLMQGCKKKHTSTAPKAKTAETALDDDDTMAYFSKLANED